VPIARLLLYLATAGGIAVGVMSVVDEPPPMWLAVSLLVSYLALCIGGVTFSRYGMFADVVTLGPKDTEAAALTFDDGPDPRSTPRILDLLDEAGVRATFFVIGRKAEEHPEIVRAISERGHAIGIHSYAHERLFSFRSPWYVRRDLERALGLVESIVGVRPRLFRAPIGHISPAMARVVRQLGLVTIGWSVRGVDGWSGAKPDRVASKIIRRLRAGAIILLHDAAERGDFIPASVDALPAILDYARRRDVELVRVDRWV
jgi:peptidoglycan/xylan/chitin deacetylase (PgdA/CDA1 family)